MNPMGLCLVFLVMLPKRDLLWMLMLPKQVSLQIYVQETLRKSARTLQFTCWWAQARSMFGLNLYYIIAQIAAFHGCEHPASLDDHADCHSWLLFHFLSGSLCASLLFVFCCPTFAISFSSETDMIGYILDVLLNSDGRLLSTENLLTCVHLFGLVQDPSLTRGRKYLHDQLLQYRTDLE